MLKEIRNTIQEFSTFFLIAALAAIPLALAGCAQLGPTAEQMKAMEGTSSSLCVEAAGWNGAPTKVHYASYGGKSTGAAGGGGEATCGASVVKFQNEGKQAPVVKPAP